jgi:hypothetical protein
MKQFFFALALLAVLAYAQAQNNCASFQPPYLYNYCGQTIGVRWVDQGRCRNGCIAYVSGNARQTVGGLDGQYRFWVCTGFGCRPN